MRLLKTKKSYAGKSSEDRDNNREYCDLCHAETPYTINTPISERKYYLVGCGQLCRECFYRLEAEGMHDPERRFVDDC